MWGQEAYVKASNTDLEDNFGWSVALSGDGETLAVGAFGESSSATGIDGDQADNAASNAGAVYVFARTEEMWGQEAYVKASNTDLEDNFGWSVALSADGNTLAIGAINEGSSAVGIRVDEDDNEGDEDDNETPYAGAAYIFEQENSIWSQTAYLKTPDYGWGNTFGQALGFSGDGSSLAVGINDSSGSTGAGVEPDFPLKGSSGGVCLY